MAPETVHDKHHQRRFVTRGAGGPWRWWSGRADGANLSGYGTSRAALEVCGLESARIVPVGVEPPLPEGKALVGESQADQARDKAAAAEVELEAVFRGLGVG